MAGNQRCLLLGLDLSRLLRAAHQRLEAADQPLPDAVERARLLAARVEGELLEQDPRERRLLREPAIVHGEHRGELRGERLPGARRSERHVGDRVQLFVEDQEHEIALVGRIVEERAQPDVRSRRDLAHRRRTIAVAGEELGGRGADAAACFEFLLLPESHGRIKLHARWDRSPN